MAGLYGGAWKGASQEARDALTNDPNVSGMGNQARRDFLSNYGGGADPSAGGGAGAGGLEGGAGGGGTTAAGYAPAEGQTSTQKLGEYGEGLMNPNSEYAKMMQAKLTGGIGADTEAQRRLASFDAAQSGMGAGGSPELSAMLGDIGIAGSERTGEGMVDLMTRGTEMGLGALEGAQQGELGYAGQNLQKELAANQEQFGRWQTEQQQRESQQRREMESWYKNREFEMQEQQAAEEAKWREFAMSQETAGVGGGGGGAGGRGGQRSVWGLATN